ncbi:MAG: Inner membrane transport protein YdhP [Chlamydiia bacterium]|nr:Inner membrane transport protein YdhP [Chlamydiia bacterium]MCH9616590.1 Inner membrane transport protein YdhP [Chlamydiia bacterium]
MSEHYIENPEGGVKQELGPPEKKCPSVALAIFTLALCSFAIGTTEFVTTGLLPEIAKFFSVSIPTAGYVTSGYAMGVVVGAPLLTAVTIHLVRKYVLIGLMTLFIIGSVISALAGSFGMLMVGRIVSAFCHGAFFGISAVVVSGMVKPEKKASAIALMFTGLTIANVVGVPMGTYLGQSFSWRFPFWVIAAMGVIGFIGILFLVPRQEEKEPPSLMRELSVFKLPRVWMALAITAFGFSGLLAAFGYISPMMVDVAGFAKGSVVWLLSLFGIGLVIGNLLGGKLADWNLRKAIYITLGLLACLLLLFTITSHAKIPAVITLFFLGVVGFGTIPGLQMQIMQKAKAAPTLASAANIAAFNFGVTMAVFFGGLAIRAGWGYSSVNIVGAILTLIGLSLSIACNLKKS